MSFTQRILFISPIALLSCIHLAQRVDASEVNRTLPQLDSRQEQSGLHTTPFNSSVVSDPQVPRGCGCSRCIQSSQILQGQFPQF
ncbi:MAG: hypothetical protein NW224_03070 [Leptolyngbyaceae cyanobacterium bins.302]|nr:hypothetical protein [Leptolyngbyaceae cyanobacterium bins.302]